MKHLSFMNETKIEEIETKISDSIHDYIDVRKLYEDELRKSHVYKEKILDPETKIQALEAKLPSLREKFWLLENRTKRRKIRNN